MHLFTFNFAVLLVALIRDQFNIILTVLISEILLVFSHVHCWKCKVCIFVLLLPACILIFSFQMLTPIFFFHVLSSGMDYIFLSWCLLLAGPRNIISFSSLYVLEFLFLLNVVSTTSLFSLPSAFFHSMECISIYCL